MKKTILILFTFICYLATYAASTTLFTGETTPEAFSRMDMCTWSNAAGNYENFGTTESPVYARNTDNPDKSGINITNKALHLKSLQGHSWWPDFLNFNLTSPITITNENRYLHIFMYRENLNYGFNVSINTEHRNGEAGKSWDLNLTAAGKWEDVVVDLKWFQDNSTAVSLITVAMDLNWGGAAESVTNYYFDEIILSNNPLPRPYLSGNNLYDFEPGTAANASIWINEGTINADNTVTYPFANPMVNAKNTTAKVFKRSVIANALWYTQSIMTFSNTVQVDANHKYLHFLVSVPVAGQKILCYIKQSSSNAAINSEYTITDANTWQDVVIDLSSIGYFTALDFRMGHWDGTAAGDYYCDEIWIDDNPNPRTNTISISGGNTLSSSFGNSTDCDITVTNNVELTIDQTQTIKSITVTPGAKLTLNSGNTLTSTNGITLQSDATGTATLMDSYTEPTISATVKQYVTAGRNWYMSAPLNNTADYAVLNKGNSVAEYNEVTGLWPTISSGTLTRGKGYVQVASASQGTTGTVSFAGTTNSGNVAVALTNTLAGGKGFNLVGNPYPSYLSWSAVAADNAAANMPTGTMWYRTISYNEKNAWAASTAYSLNTIVYNGTRFYKVTTAGTSAASGGPSGSTSGITDGSVVWNYEGSIYLFATISASGVASPATVSNLVPPMQAFWVKSTGGTLTFKNTMRSHNTGGTNALKAPKSAASDLKLIRLNVSNGASADEAVIYASADANNAFDTYDAPKYFNLAGSNQPEIYTQVGDEKLVINAMSEINQGTEIPLGFATEKGNNFTISASEFRNFGSDTKVILKDKQTSVEFDLTAGQSYPFSSSVVKSTDRFSLIFRTSGVSTDIENTKRLNAQIFVNAANQITIIAPVKSNYAIYNAVGQLIENGVATSNHQTSNFKLQTGVYMVKVNNQSTRVIVK